jgi:[histone H3]-lysine4 N-trimethyltransferase ASH1L
MALSPESSFSASVPPTDADSQVASRPESTPPTTISDAASMHSNTPKHDVITVDVAPSPSPAVNEQETATPAAASNEPTPRRGQRSRGGNPPTYNLAKLSGTAGHGKRASKGDIISFRRRRRTLGAATRDEAAKLAEDDAPTPTVSAKADERSRDALNLCNWSPEPSPSPTTRPQVRESPRHRRPTARLSETLTDSASGPTAKSTAASSKANDKPATKNNSKANGKNSGTRAVALKASSQPAPKMSRELRRLQDTKEFEHRDEQPIIYTVWAKGKYVNPNEPVEDETPRTKTKVKPTLEEQESTKSPEPIVNAGKRRVKKYLDKGLYAGQETPKDVTKGLTANEKRALSQLPQLKSTGRVNRMMPEPMFNGLRTLISGRDFKLPFHVCNPLPPGQPKPDEWKKMTKSMSCVVTLCFFLRVFLLTAYRSIHWRVEGDLEEITALP